MSKAHYPYPDDEFDAPLDPEGPHGVHRAPRSAWSRWWPFLAVLIVVPALTFAAVYALTRNGSLPAVVGGGSSSSAPSSDAPSDGATPAESGAGDAGSTAPTVGVVLSTKVTVLNAAGIKGLAAQGQGALTAAGFTAVSADNGGKGDLKESTVSYGAADLRPTAQLVATTLGLSAVVQDAAVTDGIRVTLVKALP